MSDIWAITSYFNPASDSKRLENYRIFRDHLVVPLVTVEYSHRPEFELRRRDADVLIKIRGNDVLWQKERLLNVALQALPEDCNKVAWLDCDVVFRSDKWVSAASRLLDDIPILQPFKTLHSLPMLASNRDLRKVKAEYKRLSVCYANASGAQQGIWSSRTVDRHLSPTVGMAWAARRDVLDRHGIFDAGIVGGGDRAVAAAADGSFSRLMDFHCMNEHQRRRYQEWALPFHKDTGTVGGYIEGDLFHLWHGAIGNRNYNGRHTALGSFGFDPYSDIAIADDGSWSWASDKPALHDFVRCYLVSRGNKQ